MAYKVGPYGIQYNDRENNGESHRLRWILSCILVLVVISFAWMKYRSRMVANKLYGKEDTSFVVKNQKTDRAFKEVKKDVVSKSERRAAQVAKPVQSIEKTTVAAEEKDLLRPSKATVVINKTNVIDAPKAQKKDPWLIQVSEWIASADTRSPSDRNLLERLMMAVKDEKVSLEIDSLEKLCRRPTLVDIKDALLRRLGELNMKLLKSKEPTPWVRDVTVRRGDSLNRIAREHGTTLAAVRNLNGMQQTDRLTIGDKLRVPEFLGAVLEVHKRLQIADLMLKGKFFKRYEISVDPKKTKSGPPYPITREFGPRKRFSALSIKMNPEDLIEMDMLLAPGSSLVVTEQ